MVGAVLALVDGQRALKQIALLRGVPEVAVRVAEVRQRNGHAAVIWAVLALIYGQRAF